MKCSAATQASSPGSHQSSLNNISDGVTDRQGKATVRLGSDQNIASIMHSNSMVETTVGSGISTANLSPASSLSDKRSRQTFRGQVNIIFQSGHLITGAQQKLCFSVYLV